MPPRKDQSTKDPEQKKKRGRPASEKKTFEELTAGDKTLLEIGDYDLAEPTPKKTKQQRTATAKTSSDVRVTVPKPSDKPSGSNSKMTLISDGAPAFNGHRRVATAINLRHTDETPTPSSVRRGISPTASRVAADHETLDIPESGTWSELSAAHRDLVLGPSSPSSLHNIFGAPSYPFPAAVHVTGLSKSLGPIKSRCSPTGSGYFK